MSYNGTVHCSYCGKKGHNRLGCPERRKQALAEPDSYVGRRWRREQEARKEAVSRRACSYCKGKGHNRRGCPVLKADKALIQKRQTEYRDEFFEATSSVGFGPGTLVRVPMGDSDSHWEKGYLALVQAINWPNIDFTLKDTDISKEWNGKSKALATARVVSTFGYDADDNYWNSEPKFNEITKLSAVQLHKILPSVFHESADFHNGHLRSGEAPLDLVGPVKTVLPPPPGEPLVTRVLKDSFRLDPGPRADEYSKERLPFHSTTWSALRPAEHEKALIEYNKVRRGW